MQELIDQENAKKQQFMTDQLEESCQHYEDNVTDEEEEEEDEEYGCEEPDDEDYSGDSF